MAAAAALPAAGDHDSDIERLLEEFQDPVVRAQAPIPQEQPAAELDDDYGDENDEHGHGQEDGDNWHQLARDRKKRAGLFMCVSNLGERLVCLAISLKPMMRLLDSSLKVAAQDFELRQCRLVINGEQRTFRVFESARLLPECWDGVGQILGRFPHELSESEHTCRARSMIFRSLSSFLCNIHVAIKMDLDSFPLCIFNILKGDDEAKTVYDKKACLRDQFAQEYFQIFKTWREGRSAEGLAFLEAVAIMADLDISGLEAGHSSIREWTKMRGRGHVPTLAEVSAKALCKSVSKFHSVTVGNSDDGEQQDGVERRRNKGSGGAWRAYCSEMSKGTKMTADRIKQMSADYKLLTFDEKQYYKELGYRMTIATKFMRLAAAAADTGLGSICKQHSSFVLDCTSDSVLEATPAAAALMLVGDSFEDRLSSFSRLVAAERKQARQQLVMKESPIDPTTDVSTDSAVGRVASIFGGNAHLHGLRKSPTNESFSLRHFVWRVPIAKYMQAILAKNASSGEITLAQLASKWEEDYNLFVHEPDSIQKGPHTAFTTSRCCKLGACVCGPPGRECALMMYKLTQYLKRTHPGTNKDPSVSRTQLAEHQRIMELTTKTDMDLDCDPTETSLFLHVGNINFKTWIISCLRLYKEFFNPVTGWMRLQCNNDSLEVLSLLEFLTAYCDPKIPCSVRMWGMVIGHHELDPVSLMPKYIDVTCMEPTPHQFWSGWDQEYKPKQTKQKGSQKRKSPDSALKPTGRGQGNGNRSSFRKSGVGGVVEVENADMMLQHEQQTSTGDDRDDGQHQQQEPHENCLLDGGDGDDDDDDGCGNGELSVDAILDHLCELADNNICANWQMTTLTLCQIQGLIQNIKGMKMKMKTPW